MDIEKSRAVAIAAARFFARVHVDISACNCISFTSPEKDNMQKGDALYHFPEDSYQTAANPRNSPEMQRNNYEKDILY